MLALGHKNNYGSTMAIYFCREHRLESPYKERTDDWVRNLAKCLCIRDYMQKPYRYRLENIMAVYFLLKSE